MIAYDNPALFYVTPIATRIGLPMLQPIAIVLMIVLQPHGAWAQSDDRTSKPANANDAITHDATKPDSATDEAPDISEWLENYYLHPEPDRISWLLDELVKQEILQSDEARTSVIIFLGHIFEAHPNRLTEWLPPEDRIYQDERVYLYSALWQANSPEANAILDDVQERGLAEVREQLQRIRKRQPRPILEMPITSPARLDMYWASFFATGDERYIKALRAVLRWDPNDPDVRRVLIRRAALWSLTENAKVHERVYRACQSESDDDNEFAQSDLNAIKESAAEKWEKTQHSNGQH